MAYFKATIDDDTLLEDEKCETNVKHYKIQGQ